jgi:NAD(P)-dependent dehydrogenase (short-subunit alcohol dehydrogenase family)
MAVRDLRGRRCLITGAASGIGRATAIAAAREGAHVALTDLDAAGLQATAETIAATGGTVVHTEALDLTDLDAVRAFADAVHAAGGSLDVVMNVAGIATWGSVDRLEHEHWRRTVEVDLMGPIHVIECFVPPMIAARRGGHLVNVSSAAGLIGLPWHAPYSAAKFGLRGVSEVLRFDLERHRIGVSLVCPGGVDTGMVGTVAIAGVDRDNPRMRKLTGHFQRRAVTPEKAAAAILRGVKRNRYLVYTSNDIRLIHGVQRYAPPLYALVMRALNRGMVAAIGEAAAQPRRT